VAGLVRALVSLGGFCEEIAMKNRMLHLMSAGVVAGCSAVGAAQTIGVGGNAYAHIVDALNNLGESYTVVDGEVAPGAFDIIIMAYDGGTWPAFDYNEFLNSGGDLIMTGGSCLPGDWDVGMNGYFNNEFTCWHTDGDWITSADNSITALMPDTYTPEDNSLTYHMMHLLPTPDTTLYGRNGEGSDIAAVRDYDHFGSFNYMGMDLGPYGTLNDVNNFTTPWLQGSLDYARRIPGPSAAGLLGLGALATLRRRR
jgi:hypothetical protein